MQTERPARGGMVPRTKRERGEEEGGQRCAGARALHTADSVLVGGTGEGCDVRRAEAIGGDGKGESLVSRFGARRQHMEDKAAQIKQESRAKL